MIDHVAYTVDLLEPEHMDAFMAVLGFVPFAIPDDWPQAAYEGQFNQRWYCDGGECDVHIVENSAMQDKWRWGHICVQLQGQEQYDAARHSSYCARDNGTGRAWLTGPGEIRVEVRP